jgi:hypothetical protein
LVSVRIGAPLAVAIRIPSEQPLQLNPRASAQTYAIAVPSGETTGCVSCAWSFVSRWIVVPATE